MNLIKRHKVLKPSVQSPGDRKKCKLKMQIQESARESLLRELSSTVPTYSQYCSSTAEDTQIKTEAFTSLDTLTRPLPHQFLNLDYEIHILHASESLSLVYLPAVHKNPQLCFTFYIFTICYRVLSSQMQRRLEIQHIWHYLPGRHKVDWFYSL